jgi:RNA polymerase sigma-70 factor (ECF subfamily)
MGLCVISALAPNCFEEFSGGGQVGMSRVGLWRKCLLENANFPPQAVSELMATKASDSSDLSDAQLVRSVLRGQLSAFDELVKRYQRRAVAVAYRLLNHREDAMEIAQDAFLKAYDKLDSLSKPERFGSWLLRIVSNLALNKRRWRSLRKAASLETNPQDEETSLRGQLTDTQGPGPVEVASGKEVQKKLHDLIEELPDMQKQALVLFSLQKMPQKEVAEILECSVEAVKWHVFTARKKLKEKLKDYL